MPSSHSAFICVLQALGHFSAHHGLTPICRYLGWGNPRLNRARYAVLHCLWHWDVLEGMALPQPCSTAAINAGLRSRQEQQPGREPWAGLCALLPSRHKSWPLLRGSLLNAVDHSRWFSRGRSRRSSFPLKALFSIEDDVNCWLVDV